MSLKYKWYSKAAGDSGPPACAEETRACSQIPGVTEALQHVFKGTTAQSDDHGCFRTNRVLLTQPRNENFHSMYFFYCVIREKLLKYIDHICNTVLSLSVGLTLIGSPLLNN